MGVLRICCLALLGVLAAGRFVHADGSVEARAEDIARSHILVDTHIDVPYRLTGDWADVTRATADGDFDVPRARRGGLNIPFMSIYTPAELEAEGGGFQLANQLIDSVEAMVARAPEELVLVRSPEAAEEAFRAGKVGLAMGMENGSPLDHDLTRVRHFLERGVSYITLAHSLTNHLSDSSYDENRPLQGLSDFGRQVVEEMNRVGMMVDVSHLTDEATRQVLKVSKAPVIASHSSARRFTPGFERNMSDELILALARNGGVVQINFGSTFLTAGAHAWSETFSDRRDVFMAEHGVERDSPEVEQFTDEYRAVHPFPYATVDDVLDHIDHVVELVGIDHVGLGSDFEGVGDTLPAGLKDVSMYPHLVAGLLRRGYSEADIAKILGENLLRVWRQVRERAGPAVS